MSTWTEDREKELAALIGDESPVSQATVAAAAEALEVSTRSVGAKARKMGYEVTPVSARAKVFSDEEADALADFLGKNSGVYTYAEIAAKFASGKYSNKQVQGKILSMELTDSVKATPKPESTKTYSDSEEATFVAMANDGKYLEEIAEALNRSVNSVRGKALSLTRDNTISSIPKQRDYAEKAVDPINALGDISGMTVAEIAEKTGKTERGIKTIITRRGLECANYKAKAKKSD